MTLSDKTKFEEIKKAFFEEKKLTEQQCLDLIDIVNTQELELVIAREVANKNLTLLRYYEEKHLTSQKK